MFTVVVAALAATMAVIALMGPRTTGRNLEEINPIGSGPLPVRLAFSPQQRLGLLVGVTRPLGASVADWVSKPVKVGGLSYGDGPVAAVLLVIALVLVTFVAARRSNVMSTGAKSPAWAPEIAE